MVGVAVFALYLLFHFCAIRVSCPTNKPEEVAFMFYTTYIKNTGGTRGNYTLFTDLDNLL